MCPRRGYKTRVLPFQARRSSTGLDENLGGASVELTGDELSEITDGASNLTVHGARYPESMPQIVGR